MSRHRVSVGLAALLAFAVGAPAFAQNKDAKPKRGTAAPVASVAPSAEPPPGPKPLAEVLTGDAKADYDSGKLLFGDRDFAGALVKFQGAFDKSKDVRLLWNMAACEKNLRHYARTLTLVRRYAAEGGDALTEQDRKDADDLIRAIEPLTAALKLKVAPDGAQVFIDDELVGTAPVEKPVIVDIGMRKIRVKAAEHEEHQASVPVGGAAELALDVSLVRIVHEGDLKVRVKPAESDILVDGRAVGRGTAALKLPSGGHTLRVTAKGMLPYQAEVLIQDKQTRAVDVALEAEPSSGIPVWAWIGGAAVIVGGGVATAVALLGGSEQPADFPKGNLGTGFAEAGHKTRLMRSPR